MLIDDINAVLTKYRVLNTMEICRAINGHSPFYVGFCGTPVYMKPFANKGKILDEYRKQTGNGICANFCKCSVNYTKVYRTLKRSGISSIKRQAPDTKARIKKSRFKTDLFRFWFFTFADFDRRLNVDKSISDYIEGASK